MADSVETLPVNGRSCVSKQGSAFVSVLWYVLKDDDVRKPMCNCGTCFLVKVSDLAVELSWSK
jgi:hypothetical protein